jgi:hypothetical protein
MKSLLRKDDVAAAIGGFNSTENAVFDFIRFSGLHRVSDFIPKLILGFHSKEHLMIKHLSRNFLPLKPAPQSQNA